GQVDGNAEGGENLNEARAEGLHGGVARPLNDQASQRVGRDGSAEREVLVDPLQAVSRDLRPLLVEPTGIARNRRKQQDKRQADDKQNEDRNDDDAEASTGLPPPDSKGSDKPYRRVEDDGDDGRGVEHQPRVPERVENVQEDAARHERQHERAGRSPRHPVECESRDWSSGVYLDD